MGWLRRELTLYDSAAAATPAALSPRSEGDAARRSWRSLVAAIVLPAALAWAGGVLLTPGSSPPGAAWANDATPALTLARLASAPATVADLPPLVPMVERGGRPELASYPPAAAHIRPSTPKRISIPGAGVSARVDAVAARRSGLELPRSRRAGWWSGGPRPGEPGRAVIVGHLDSTRGPDVFARVPALKRGAPIAVRDASGDLHLYSVIGVTRVRKANFPTEAVYGPARRPVLVLVTCGGPYDAARGHYRDNVLVYARAV